MALNEPPILNPMPPLTARKVVLSVLVVLSVIASFLLIINFRDVVILVFMGVVLSVSMAPSVDWLHQHGIPRPLGGIIIYLLLLLLLLFILLLVIPQTIQQISTLLPVFEQYYENFQSILKGSAYPSLHQLAENLPATLSLIPNVGTSGIQTGSQGSIDGTLNIVLSVINGLFTFSVVLLIGFYWKLEGERVLYNFLLLLPSEKRESARETIQEIEGRVGGFVRGQGLLALTIGTAAMTAYLLIGLPSVLSLAFLAGVFELVPVFGPVLGAAPAVLVAFSAGPSKVLWVVGSTVLIQFLENHLLAPRIMQKTVGVNPIVTILAIASFGSLFGFSGLLLAIPLAAVFQVLLDRSLLHPQGPPLEAPVGRDRISKLSYDAQEFVQDVRKRVRGKEVGMVNAESDEVEDAIESIATDLDNLLSSTTLADVSE